MSIELLNRAMTEKILCLCSFAKDGSIIDALDSIGYDNVSDFVKDYSEKIKTVYISEQQQFINVMERRAYRDGMADCLKIAYEVTEQWQ